MSTIQETAHLHALDAVRLTRGERETEVEAARRLLGNGVSEWVAPPGMDASAYKAAVQTELETLAGVATATNVIAAPTAVSASATDPVTLREVASEAADWLMSAADVMRTISGAEELAARISEVEARLRTAIRSDEEREARRLHGCTGALAHQDGVPCPICDGRRDA